MPTVQQGAYARPTFRFDKASHTYTDLLTGEELPYISAMLERGGWHPYQFYTEESRDRGTAVHSLCADYDLEALDLATCTSKYKGYLLAHVAAVGILRPTFHSIEEPRVHPRFRFGGRPDRGMTMDLLGGVWEVKSGQEEKGHRIQTALQAILEETETRVPAESQARVCCYVKANGKFKVIQHHKEPGHRRDFDEARRIVRLCCTY